MELSFRGPAEKMSLFQVQVYLWRIRESPPQLNQGSGGPLVELLPRSVTGLLTPVVESFYVESSESRLRHITLPYKPREFTMRIEYRHHRRQVTSHGHDGT